MQDGSKAQSMFELVEQWQQSGKSQKQFSGENHITLCKFLYWVQKYRQSSSSNQGFASLSISSEESPIPSMPKIEIELSSGIVVRIF